MVTKLSKPIKLGVVGAGYTGRQAALCASQMACFNAVAVADPNGKRREDMANEFDIGKRYTDCQELLDDDEVEAVYLGVTPDIRKPMTLNALRAGKHVLIQKPHATRANEILEFQEAAEQAGRVAQFCFYLRHLPHNRAIRQAIADGKIGEPYHGRYFSKNASPPMTLNDANRWLHIYGLKGGVLSQHMSHDLNLLWWWMGCPDPVFAFAAKHHLQPIYHGPEGPSENYFSGLIGFTNNKTIQIDCSNSSHCDSQRICELHGSEGAVSGNARCGLSRISNADPNEAIFRRTENGYQREEINAISDIKHSTPPEEASSFYHEIERFAMAITGKTQPEVAAPEAHTFMKILDALYDSARSSEKIIID